MAFGRADGLAFRPLSAAVSLEAQILGIAGEDSADVQTSPSFFLICFSRFPAFLNGR